jgi:hypothetical protein
MQSGLALRQHVERELYALSSNANSDQARLRALELLGKTERCGVFLERKTDVTDNMTEEEVQAGLEQKLQAYFKASNNILVTVETPIPNCRAILRLPVPSALAASTASSTSPDTFGRPNVLP